LNIGRNYLVRKLFKKTLPKTTEKFNSTTVKKLNNFLPTPVVMQIFYFRYFSTFIQVLSAPSHKYGDVFM